MPGGLGGVMNGASGAGSGAGCSGPGGGMISGPGVAGGMISGPGRSGPGVGGGCGPCGGTSGDWAADMVGIGLHLFRWCQAEASSGACGSHHDWRTSTRVSEGGGRDGKFLNFSPRACGRGLGGRGQAGTFSFRFALPQRNRIPQPLPRGAGEILEILSRF
jgi:hypothetical protein